MDNELIFWGIAAISGVIAAAGLWFQARRVSENYIDWATDPMDKK